MFTKVWRCVIWVTRTFCVPYFLVLNFRACGVSRAWLALHARGWHYTRVVGITRAWLALHARGWHYTCVVGTTRAWLTLHARGWHYTCVVGIQRLGLVSHFNTFVNNAFYSHLFFSPHTRAKKKPRTLYLKQLKVIIFSKISVRNKRT